MAGQEQVGTQGSLHCLTIRSPEKREKSSCPASLETLVKSRCFFLVAPPSMVTLLH